MGATSVRQVVDAELDGGFRYAGWRKVPSQTTTANVWYDLSYAPGNPIPQYYASTPLKATVLRRSTDIGLDHGPSVAPQTKYLRRFMATTYGNAVPSAGKILDYLVFYPFCDEGTTDTQTMDNTATLPRYTDGEGVQMFAVSQGGRVSNQTFQVTYTNQDGVTGQLSQVVSTNSNAATGSLVATGPAGWTGIPFIPLQAGDTGVRQIESVQMISGTDIGLFALVLAKPIATWSCREAQAAVEIDYLADFAQLPTIEDDAYLNLLVVAQGSIANIQFMGELTTVWSD